jgi:hypothetical protein
LAIVEKIATLIIVMLDYGQAMLVSQVRTQVSAAGFDPPMDLRIAAWKPISPVYHLMEPPRQWRARHGKSVQFRRSDLA